MASITLEGDSIESLRAEAAARIPSGEVVLSEVIESDGRARSVRSIGATAGEAQSKAANQVPAGATVLGTTLVRQEKSGSVTVDAADEQQARAMALADGGWTVVDSVVQASPGSRGFLGIGKRSPQWTVAVQRSAEFEIKFQPRAKLVVTTGTTPGNWTQLIGAIRAAAPGGSPQQLMESLPYHVQFVIVTMKVDEPAYYTQIPFVDVTPALVACAKKYRDRRELPGILGIMGSLDANRYQVVGPGRIGRMTNPAVDGAIMGVASCLPRQHVPATDTMALGRLAFDAIKHYALIPAVRFCFSLPYLDASRHSRQIDPTACEAEVYQATEALLLQIWDELPDGGVITDDLVLQKVRSILSAT